jgi:hypothetical protein
MATYTHGPNIQSFDTPIFEHPTEFLFQISRQKQLQFDSGLRAVGSEYRNMASLGVSSQIGLAKRDSYIKEAENRLKSIATADFSLQENRAVASSVYKPLTEDKDIIYDLTQTRNAQKQMEYMDRLQNSKDEKERAMYWDTGRAYVNKSIMDLQGASTSEQLQQTKVRQFVPYVDIIGKLNKAAKDMDLSVSYDRVKDGYILTDKNGKKAELPFYIFAQSQLGAQEREVLKVMGSVEADTRIRNTMTQFGVDEGSARQLLAKEAINERFGDYQEMIDSNNLSLNSQKSKKERLLKESKGDITDTNIAAIADIDMAIKSIEESNSQINERIRNLGYEKLNGQWVQHKENYSKQLGAFATDLAIPYMESAGKNILRNWAAGYANATASQKVGSDPVYLKGIDLQLEAIKANATLASEQAKLKTSTESSTTSKKTSGTTEKEEAVDPGDRMILTGYNPYGQERASTYEVFKANQKAFQEHLFTEGTDLIQDVVGKKLGLSEQFLTSFAGNLKNGASTESLLGATPYALDRQFPEDMKKLRDAIENGDLPGADGTYLKTFRAMVNLSDKEVANMLNTASTESEQATVSRILKTKDEVRKNGEIYQIYKDDEKVINEQILAKPEFSEIKKGNDILTLPEYLDKQGQQVYTAFIKTSNSAIEKPIQRQMSLSEIRKMMSSYPDAKIGLRKETPEEIKALLRKGKNLPIGKSAQEVIGSLEKRYNTIKANFDRNFSEYVGSSKLQYLKKTPSGELAYVYPNFEFPLRKQTEKFNTSEKGELLLKEALSPGKLTDETKVGNLFQLGSWSSVKPVLDNILSMAVDMKAEDGRLFYSEIGADGKTPSIIFRPTPEFLKSLETKQSGLDQDIINNIKRFGIEINAPVNQTLVSEHRPSIIARLIDINKSDYGVLPELRDQGFSAKVVKLTNGRGFDIEMDYKYFDPMTREEKTMVGDRRTAISGPIPQSRLDDVVNALYNDLLQFYFQYKQTKNTVKETQERQNPPKVYTEQEYKAYLQTRQ